MGKYDNKYGVDVENYCTRHACMDCEYFDNVHLSEINKNCPLLPLKDAALADGYAQLFDDVKQDRLSKVEKWNDEKTLRIVNLSGGKDSTALLLMLLSLGVRIDFILFADTGKDFPQMLDHLRKLAAYIKERYPTAPEITTLKADDTFDFLMFEKQKSNGVSGYGWANARMRWCTGELKKRTIDKFCKSLGKKYIHYVGIAADEPKRLKVDPRKAYPLAAWGVTEAEALEYCYRLGFDWGGSYTHFDRVSCWCCPLKNLKELKTLWKHYPELWAELKQMDERAYNQFRADYSVADLEERFIKEEGNV